MSNEANEFQRDELGLLGGVEYSFQEDGLIDWRKMLNDKWLYPNPSKNLGTSDISGLKDTDLCILLGGIKELAQIRGYTNIEYNLNVPSDNYVVATCKITWTPNFETEGNEVVFSSIGDASYNNTIPINGVYYLAATAENRAFVRCVRNFLRINIVAKDELAKKNDSAPVASSPQQPLNLTASPVSLLSQMMSEKNVNFDKIKKRLVRQKCDGAENFTSVDDIPTINIFDLLDALRKV